MDLVFSMLSKVVFISLAKILSYQADMSTYTMIFTTYTVQRAITAKVGKPQLWFLFSACCLMVLNISVKFCENISNGFQVTDRT